MYRTDTMLSHLPIMCSGIPSILLCSHPKYHLLARKTNRIIQSVIMFSAWRLTAFERRCQCSHRVINQSLATVVFAASSHGKPDSSADGQANNWQVCLINAKRDEQLTGHIQCMSSGSFKVVTQFLAHKYGAGPHVDDQESLNAIHDRNSLQIFYKYLGMLPVDETLGLQ